MSNLIRFTEIGKVLKPRNNWQIAIYVISIFGILLLLWFYWQNKKEKASNPLPDSKSPTKLTVELSATQVSDKISIKVISQQADSYTFQIQNQFKIVLLDHKTISNEHTFDVSSLLKGKYFVSVTTGSEIIEAGLMGFEKV